MRSLQTNTTSESIAAIEKMKSICNQVKATVAILKPGAVFGLLVVGFINKVLKKKPAST
ncbi:hypothetical protein [Nostoc sp.]|uniref:hypothetical protein n=1 Tax=Nostoc sp. TaxID=1180 RepID=UPI002FFA7E2C